MANRIAFLSSQADCAHASQGPLALPFMYLVKLIDRPFTWSVPGDARQGLKKSRWPAPSRLDELTHREGRSGVS